MGSNQERRIRDRTGPPEVVGSVLGAARQPSVVLTDGWPGWGTKVTPAWGLVRRLLDHLGRRRRIQFYAITAAMFVSGALELVSVGAVFPFVAALANPGDAAELPLVRQLVSSLEIGTPEGLVRALAIGFASAVVAAGVVRLLLQWLIMRFSVAAGADLSRDMYRRSLEQPYRVQISRNSSEIISASIKKVDVAALGTLAEFQRLVYSTILVVFVVTTLFLVEPLVAVLSFGIFGGAYLLIGVGVRSRLHRNSATISDLDTAVVKSVQEGLGGIRDILLDGTQDAFVHSYRRADHPLRMARGVNAFLSSSPRLLMEIVGLTLFCGVAYALNSASGGIAAGLPLLGTMALGGFRLLPSLQQAYGSWSGLRGNRVSAEEVLALLGQPLEQVSPGERTVSFSESVAFEDVGFRYDEDGPWIIENAEFVVPKGSVVGLVGETGSGKSTVLDLVMGLLEPSSGQIRVDGVPLDHEILPLWRRHVAHVPQEVFLSDSSFSENIAFGTAPERIDRNHLERVAEIACIREFIEGHHSGFEERAGERGARLSGGQCQRIGIARALYKRSNLLILDEATSALDGDTETKVLKGILSYMDDLTVIIVTHRPSVLEFCDQVFRVINGGVLLEGPAELR